MEGAKDNEENECFACNHYLTFWSDRLWDWERKCKLR